MTAYADVTYYIEQFYGTAIAQDEFPRLALRASSVIDAATFGRAATVIDANEDTATVAAIRNATCAVAEVLAELASGEIASERVGEHSVSYTQTPEQKVPGLVRMLRAAKPYLASTGLMYAGVDDVA